METWYEAVRGDTPYLWRFCTCDDWAADYPAVGRHIRERVPGTTVEICYHPDEATKTITVLKIRTMPEDEPK